MRRFVIMLSFGCAGVAAAQDIEMRSVQSGRPLPQAYFDRIARDPNAFELTAGWRSRLAAAVAQPTAGQAIVSGVLRMAVIPTLFSNSGTPPSFVSTAAMQSALFDGPANETVTGYFQEVSLGKLSVVGSVSPWVATTMTVAQVVGTSYGLGSDSQVGPWLRQAVEAADAHIDFRQYDNDGPDGLPNSGDDDGVADGVAFLFVEKPASCPGPGPWPHRSRIQNWGGGPAVTNDLRPDGQAIVVNDYILLGAVECSGVDALGPDVFAHETGHVLGLPDYYDLSQGVERHLRRFVVGCYELMSAGSWGCGNGGRGPSKLPSHMGPWPKVQLQWTTPIQVPSDARRVTYTLNPVRSSGEMLSVPLSATERLFIEYRDLSGFDRDLPRAGVVMYRHESGRAFLPPAGAVPRTYSYALIEADGNSALVRTELEGGNRGEAGDIFRSAGPLHNGTSPAIRLNAGAASTVTIHSIVVDDVARTARVTLTTAPTPEFTAPVLSTLTPIADTLKLEMAVNGGALPYVPATVGALPAGLTLSVEGETLKLSGTPLASGTFPVSIGVRDASGLTVVTALALTVSDLVISGEALFASLPGGSGALIPAEATYVDQMGNANGALDVGDVRAYLKRMSVLNATAARARR